MLWLSVLDISHSLKRMRCSSVSDKTSLSWTSVMKMSERWCPFHVVPSFSLFQTKSPSNSHYASHHDVSGRRDVTPWRHVTWRHTVSRLSYSYMAILILCHLNQYCNIFWPCDLDLWPMTLLIKLDLDILYIHLPAKIHVSMLNGLAPRALNDRQTDTQTGPMLYPRQLTWQGMRQSTSVIMKLIFI